MGRFEQQCRFYVGFCGDVGLVLGKCVLILLRIHERYNIRRRGYYREQGLVLTLRCRCSLRSGKRGNQWLQRRKISERQKSICCDTLELVDFNVI